jgi:predicted membrane channel-forming protein YqfA (hemolysin III family)
VEQVGKTIFSLNLYPKIVAKYGGKLEFFVEQILLRRSQPYLGVNTDMLVLEGWRIRFSHRIWHLWVLAGSTFHFFSIMTFL